MSRALMLDPTAYRDRLTKVWRIARSNYTARAVVEVLRGMVNEMATIREDLGVGTWPLEKSTETRALRGWDHEFLAVRERLNIYRSELPPCWGSRAECWQGDEKGQTEEQYLVKWVINPILTGKTVPDIQPSLGTAYAKRPEAIEAAMLWNQLVTLKEFQSSQRDISSHIGEWLVFAERELQRSAPGESQTIRDKVTNALDKLGDAALTIVEGLKIAGGIAAVGIGIGLAFKYGRRRRT